MFVSIWQMFFNVASGAHVMVLFLSFFGASCLFYIESKRARKVNVLTPSEGKEVQHF